MFVCLSTTETGAGTRATARSQPLAVRPQSLASSLSPRARSLSASSPRTSLSPVSRSPCALSLSQLRLHRSHYAPTPPATDAATRATASLARRSSPAAAHFTARCSLASHPPFVASFVSRSPATPQLLASPAARQQFARQPLASYSAAACRPLAVLLASRSQAARKSLASRIPAGSSRFHIRLSFSLTVSLSLCLSVQATKAGAGSALALYVQ